MKNKIKDVLESALYWFFIKALPVLIILFALFYVFLLCYCYITYGDELITEVPAWSWWIILGM